MNQRQRRRRQSRNRLPSPLADKPFRRLVNPFAPLEVLTPDQVERLHLASMDILENVGLEFLDAEALALWSAAGARVDTAARRVWPDRGLVMALIDKAPASFTLHARNPEHSVEVGGNAVNFATVGAAPYFADLDAGRRPGTLADFRRMVKLAQLCGPIHIVEGLLVEPQDVTVSARNLEKGRAVLTLSDKAMTTAAHGRIDATDYVNMGAIVFGGLEFLQTHPVMASNVNANSPLRYDGRMLAALLVYARHRQPVIITPFILAGAMSPVTVAAAIAQQNAEALAGIALTQLVSPGAPVVYGGFTTNIDLRSGSPAFGTPEGALALLAGAQLARRYGLPYRGSGGLNTAKSVDAQAGYETQMSLWPAVLGHANIVLHSAGWLESGLVCSLEKFIVDVEGLAMMQRFLDGIDIDDDSLALSSIATVGPGGHHLSTDHTMAHFRTAFYQPLLSDRQSYEAWLEAGALDAARRAHQLALQLEAEYQPPPMDPAVRQELDEYVVRRREETG